MANSVLAHKDHDSTQKAMKRYCDRVRASIDERIQLIEAKGRVNLDKSTAEYTEHLNVRLRQLEDMRRLRSDMEMNERATQNEATLYNAVIHTYNLRGMGDA